MDAFIASVLKGSMIRLTKGRRQGLPSERKSALLDVLSTNRKLAKNGHCQWSITLPELPDRITSNPCSNSE